MATTTNSRTSFFDDDDLNIKFEWEKLDKTPFKDILKQSPLLKDILNKAQPNSSNIAAGYFHLYPRCIVHFKNSSSKQPEAVLDISNSRLKALTNGPLSGFSLSKNGNTFEFTSKDEAITKAWTEQLKGICVQSTFHEDYKAIKMIGKGSFAKVYLVEAKTGGKSYAVKAFTKEGIILSNKNNAKPSMINEIDIMRSLTHENIIQLYEVYETEKSIYLVLELIQGKALQDVIKKATFREAYTEIKVINLMRSLLDALAYLSEKGIMHRDLKPDNILLDKNDKLKVVDFGLATFINLDTYIFKKCGTPGYIAPEVFKYDEKNPLTNYDDRCDVFSAGSIFFYMLFGYPFFDGSNASEILKMNRKFTTEFEALATVKQELKNPSSKINKEGLTLLMDLLEFDHKNRIRAGKALQHPYFTPIPTSDKQERTPTNVDSPTLISKGKESPTAKEVQVTIVKQNSIKYQKDKYEQKDSLYIDVGQPLLNGKTDTLASGVGSHNNSLLLGQGPQGSNPNSLSKFAGGGKSGANDLRKAAILKNSKFQPDSDGESPESSKSRERSNSVGYHERKEKSPDNIEDVSNENPQVQNNVDKISLSTSDKHPSKLITPGKRYSLLENRSAGNSPKLTGGQAGYSKFGEETKTQK